MSDTDTRLEIEVNAEALGGARLQLISAKGTRRLSRLFEYEVLFETDVDDAFDDEGLDALLTHPVLLRLGYDTYSELQGVFRRIEMLSAQSDSEGTRYRYRATLVPALWRLTLSRRTRVFQDKSHLEIVKAVLDEEGILYRDECSGSYETREYTVQHQESSFDFISRLLEHHGIHYHFVRGDGSEEMVLADSNSGFESCTERSSLGYRTLSGAAVEDPGYLTSLRRVREARASKVVVRDYNWRTPSVELKAEADADTATGYGIRDYFGDHFREAESGDTFARLRAEEQLADADLYYASSIYRELIPGRRFNLEGHPLPDLNKEYVVTEIREGLGPEAGGEGGRYLKELVAIPYARPFRPKRITAWPRIEGAINARVDGEIKSTAAPIDELGRYKLLIAQDEISAPTTEESEIRNASSRWVRRAQPSAGAGVGTHLPLHIGTEVALIHINGDPDRPVILGAVPNTETPSPVVQENATQSRIASTGVLIEFDDDCGGASA